MTVLDRPVPAPSPLPPALPDVPAGSGPPPARRLWTVALVLGFLALGWVLLDRLTLVLMDYWLLESLGYPEVFWTNFTTGAVLFGAAFVLFLAAVVAPAVGLGIRGRNLRLAVGIGVFGGLLAGFLLAGHFLVYLAMLGGQDFGRVDPVFGNEIGFYVFDLPALVTSLHVLVLATVTALVATVVCAHLTRERRPVPDGAGGFVRLIAGWATAGTTVLVAVLGLLLAVETWLLRYELLYSDNSDSAIPAGADALDVTGLLSTRHMITVDALVVLAVTAGLTWKLHTLRRAARDARPPGRGLRPRALALVVVPPVVLAIVFGSLTALRQQTVVLPNEPVVQLPFIQAHIDATNAAYGLDAVEEIPFVPNGPGDPAPDVDALLAHPTIRNAPLWPGYVSQLERQIDPEYRERILATDGDTTIYGPTLDIFQQQQKLRPYYQFMDVDVTSYDGAEGSQLFVSSVRELPNVADKPQAWLMHWGQRLAMFTHGYGLVAAPAAQSTVNGTPEYVSSGIPATSEVPALQAEQQAVYYGEGAELMALSNLNSLAEHDYPTEQDRAETVYPPDVRAGVQLDSALKRLVVGWQSGTFLQIALSDLITDDSRVHYYRAPLERLDRIAPFLYLDSDPYAMVADGRVTWMVNGLTTSDRYPYSLPADLGDKSDRRTPLPRDTRVVNYVEDSVKATVDAYTGAVQLYRISDDPVVATWASVYPGLFQDGSAMPDDVRAQLQYPTQLMHVQFDDKYVYYHQRDALTYFGQEDLLDDADEVVGPLLQAGRGITFSVEPYPWIAGPDVADGVSATAPGGQFALSAVFTPEAALNLRAIATAYQNGADYGRLHVLSVPKATFSPGPEQVDAAIDQDPFIAQQIGLWNRQGVEVIRGHTVPLVIDSEVLYVEPMFIRSAQNPVPQLERVVVVYRGEPAIGNTLEQALRAAIEGAPEASLERDGQLPLPGDPGVPVSTGGG